MRPRDKKHKRSTHSTLLYAAQLASNLSELYLCHHYHDNDVLHGLIASALDNLLKCVDIITPKAPISRLPTEVLDMVFRTMHEGALALSPQERLATSSRFPHSISCVSRSWHNHVNNLPILWTLVNVSPYLGFPFTALWLDRSSPLPIHLNLVAEARVRSGSGSEPSRAGSPKNYLPEPGAAELAQFEDGPFYDLLYAHLPRCRSISILVDENFEFLEKTLRRWCENMTVPHLESFAFQAEAMGHSSSQVFGGGAPNLRRIHMTPTGIVLWKLPFTNVVILHLETQDDLYLHELFHVLSNCSLLETLTISGGLISFFDPEDFRPHSESLPHLRSLRLYDVDIPLAECLNILNDAAPGLESLVLVPYATYHLQQNDASHLLKITSLKSVTLAPPANDVEQSLALASTCFPNVEHVTLVCKSNPQLRALSFPSATSDGILFPNVHFLDFE